MCIDSSYDQGRLNIFGKIKISIGKDVLIRNLLQLEELLLLLILRLNLLEALADDALPAATGAATRLSPVCRWRVELLDGTVRVVMSTWYGGC